ncbi:MAG TPA: hypothetical protein VJZ77_08170, partial [Blastocatellia bacterium]|nr:hypothetical protein [Blastocatellia bacterium]
LPSGLNGFTIRPHKASLYICHNSILKAGAAGALSNCGAKAVEKDRIICSSSSIAGNDGTI